MHTQQRFVWFAIFFLSLVSSCSSGQGVGTTLSAATRNNIPSELAASATPIPTSSATPTPVPSATPLPSLTPTPTLTPTATLKPSPTSIGNSGRFFYNACSYGDQTCTATFSFDIAAKTSQTIAPAGHSLYSISPDGRKFIAEQKGVGIYVKEIDKPDRIFLQTKFYYRRMMWLGDSQHIIYITEIDGERYIYTALWDGSNPKLLSKKGDKPLELTNLTSAVDGTRIYYDRADILSSNSWRPLGSKWINLETGEQGEVPDDVGIDNSFSPTSQQVAFWGSKKLFLKVDAYEPKSLLGKDSINPNTRDFQMQGNVIWSADGTRLFSSVLNCSPGCEKTYVYIFSTETGALIAEFPQFNGFLKLESISPDGRLGLLFGHENSTYASKPVLYLLDMETLAIQRLDTIFNLPYFTGGWYGRLGWLPASPSTPISSQTPTPTP